MNIPTWTESRRDDIIIELTWTEGFSPVVTRHIRTSKNQTDLVTYDETY